MKKSVLGVMATLAAATWAASAMSYAATEVSDAPVFSVAGEGGNKLNLVDFRGKVVYLDFFASWCGPCRASFKWLNEAHEKYAGRGLVVVAVNVDKEKELAAQFLRDNPAKFRIGYDPEGSVAQAYRLKGMPVSYLIDRKGQIRTTHLGYREKDKGMLNEEIRKLLDEIGSPVAQARTAE